MKITAITRYKHGELYAILKRIGWTQTDLSRQSNVSLMTIGKIINLVRRPTPEQADAIQKALGTAGEYLDVLDEWPETFQGLKRGYRREQTADVPMERLLDHPEVLQIAAPEYEDTMQLADDIMQELPERMRSVLRERLWNNKSQKQVAKKMKCTESNVGVIERRAMFRLRHPYMRRKYKRLIEDTL